MKDWTGFEIERARQGLEQASATILGRMIFEYSRLDVALGLLLVWSDGGSQLEQLTKTIASYTFHKKLDLLEERAIAKYKDEAEPSALYSSWLHDAHSTRSTRNELVHGRWGVDPMKSEVVNVVGLPTSSEQRETRYTITELKSMLQRMEQLQLRLSELKARWPI